MPFATTHTVALTGASGHLIDVQADVSPGHVATVLVGRPDASLNEARDRCRIPLVGRAVCAFRLAGRANCVSALVGRAKSASGRSKCPDALVGRAPPGAD